MNIRLSLVLCLFAGVLMQANTPVSADDFVLEDPYYSLYRTWALSTPESEAPFKITTFIPEGYLFHVLQRDSQIVSNSRYSRVLTQDGVEALIYSGAISQSTYNHVVGDHELIFNSGYRLCKNPFCNKLSDSVWNLVRGESFKIILSTHASPDKRVIKIRATRDWQAIDGYLTTTELAELTERGLVTRTDQVLPRYRINKSKSAVLSTSCSEQRSMADRVDIPKGDLVSRRLAQLLNMTSKQDAGHIELAKNYGSDEHQYSFYLYEVEDRSVSAQMPQRFFDVAAGFKISCTKPPNQAFSTKDYIDHVIYVDSRNQVNNQPIEVNIASNLFNTPRDIRQYTGDAYMLSINKPEHFEQAIEILAKKIGDRTLAGYMLSELNRSCRSEMRVQYSGSVCRIYDY